MYSGCAVSVSRTKSVLTIRPHQHRTKSALSFNHSKLTPLFAWSRASTSTQWLLSAPVRMYSREVHGPSSIKSAGSHVTHREPHGEFVRASAAIRAAAETSSVIRRIERCSKLSGDAGEYETGNDVAGVL